jgi:hypothetical protein
LLYVAGFAGAIITVDTENEDALDISHVNGQCSDWNNFQDSEGQSCDERFFNTIFAMRLYGNMLYATGYPSITGEAYDVWQVMKHPVERKIYDDEEDCQYESGGGH